MNEKLLEYMVIKLLFLGFFFQNQDDVTEPIGIGFATRASTKLFVLMIMFSAVDVVVVGVVTLSTILHVSYQV